MQNIVDHFDFRALYAGTTEYVSRQLREKITDRTLEGIGAFYLTGCGDSLFEAYAVQSFFEKYTGVPTQALEALEFTKYRAGYLPEGSAVFCISNSGGASRTVESVRTANAVSALSIAVSGSDTSPLAENAKLLIHRPVPQFPGVMGSCGRVVRNMAEYVVSLHVLCMIALHIARLRGRITQAEHDSLLERLLELPERILRTAQACGKPVCRFADSFRDEDAMFFLGAGPNYATALFGGAKLLEDVPVNGVPQWLEEWAHLQYFLSLEEAHKPPLAVIAAPGRSRERAAEIVASAVELGVPVLELRSAGDSGPVLSGSIPLPVHDEGVAEELSPAVYCVPLQLLGIFWAIERGRDAVPLSRGDAYRLIRGSQIRVDYCGMDGSAG